jgi:hypothetical protein
MITDPEVAHFARWLQRIKRSRDLFRFSQWVRAMQQQNIEVVGLQSLQTALH